MYVVYINLLYFLSIFLFTYNKNLLSQKKITGSGSPILILTVIILSMIHVSILHTMLVCFYCPL